MISSALPFDAARLLNAEAFSKVNHIRPLNGVEGSNNGCNLTFIDRHRLVQEMVLLCAAQQLVTVAKGSAKLCRRSRQREVKARRMMPT